LYFSFGEIDLLGIFPANHNHKAIFRTYAQVRGDNVQEMLGAIGPLRQNRGLDDSRAAGVFTRLGFKTQCFKTKNKTKTHIFKTKTHTWFSLLWRDAIQFRSYETSNFPNFRNFSREANPEIEVEIASY